MGCLVGIRGAAEMKERFPYVDVFSQPSDPHPLIDFLSGGSQQQVLKREQQIEDILDADFAYTLAGFPQRTHCLCPAAGGFRLLARLRLLRHSLAPRSRDQPPAA